MLKLRAALSVAVLAFTAAETCAAERANRDWLVKHLTQDVSQSPGAKLYLDAVDRAELAGLIDRTWLENGVDSGKGRLVATQLGQLAFAWRTPGTRWHKSDKLLDDIRAGFRGFAAHQTDEGRFVWPQQQTYEYQAHEHVWRLEPLLLAYIWVEPALAADERESVTAMLRKAGEYLLKLPLTEANNRGAVWASGAALCGAYFADDRYWKMVAEHGPKIIDGVLHTTGEVVETQGGGGPDGNYSYVGFTYAWMYQRLTGDAAVREQLLASTRWVVNYATLDGALLAPGATTRKGRSHGELAGVLPAIEEFAVNEPFFRLVTEWYLKSLGPSYGRTGIIGHPMIWAMLEAAERGPEQRDKIEKESKDVNEQLADGKHWYTNHVDVYEWPEVHYLLVGRPGYQVGVTFRSRFPAIGLQTCARNWEPTLLVPNGKELAAQSLTDADGVNTSRESVAKGPHGWELIITRTPAANKDTTELVTVLVRQKHLWTCYAFTPESLTVVYGGAKAAMRSVWILNATAKADLIVTERQLAAIHGTACISYLHGEASFQNRGDFDTLEVRTDKSWNAFGLIDEEFGFQNVSNDGQEIQFRDSSGRYRLSLAGILDDQGNLNRHAAARIVVFP